MSEIKDTKSLGFGDLGVSATILAALEKLKIETPSPIQRKAIPHALAGEDLIGIAQTGTGKTYAFGVPMLQRIALNKGRGLILLPTRELALQVEESLRHLGLSMGLRTAALIGGESAWKQTADLRRIPHIIVATPGRLIDHIKRKTVKLNDVNILVLDEADMMLDMGFVPQVEEILKHVPTERQTMLFSATMPAAIVRLATNHMKLPISIEVAPAGTTVDKIDQEIHVMRKEDKLDYLEKVLTQYTGSVLVFSRTKHGAKALANKINAMGHRSNEIHSNRSLAQRKEALAGFKSKKYRVLIATDIAARGIDVKGVELVLNFDLPDNSDDYVHRIGRTGRAGAEGKAISFATPSQSKEIREIERLIKKQIPMKKFTEFDRVQTHPTRQTRGGGRSNAARNSGFTTSNDYYSHDKPAARKFEGKRNTPNLGDKFNFSRSIKPEKPVFARGGAKPYGEKREFGNKKFGDRKPFGERPSNAKMDHPTKKYGDAKPFGEKREYGVKSFGDKKFGDRKPAFGEKKEYVSRKFGERATADKKFGDKKPFTAKKFGDKPFGKKTFDSKPGGRKPSFSKSDSKPAFSRDKKYVSKKPRTF